MYANNFGQQGQPHGAQNVNLPLVPWSMYRGTDNEPQPVTSKQPPSAHIYLYSEDLPAGTSHVDFVISNNVTYLSNVSRINFVGTGILNWYIPNVNPRNNNIVFHSSSSGLDHSVFIPEGRYATPAAMIAAIVSILNTATGASGLTFSSSAIALLDGAYTLSAAGGTFYILDSCTAVTRGHITYMFASDQVLSASKQVGPMPLYYTLFVDICSTTLTKYAKLRTITSGARGDIFARAFMGAEAWGSAFYAATTPSSFSFGFRPNEVMTTIDIQLRDSWGDILYVPPYLEKNLSFQMTIHVEM